MTIGDRIRKTRVLKGISQTGLANAVHITKQTLYKYETNIVTNIPLNNVERIAKALDVTPAFLMGWENSADISIESEVFSPHEKKVITAYRSKPDMQPVVDKLLDVPSEDIQPPKSNIARIAALDGDGMSTIELPNTPEDIARQDEAARRLRQNRKLPRNSK